MDSSLNLIIQLVDTLDYSSFEYFLCVPHGLNNFRDWKYFRETEVIERYRDMLEATMDHCEIVSVREIDGYITLADYT